MALEGLGLPPTESIGLVRRPLLEGFSVTHFIVELLRIPFPSYCAVLLVRTRLLSLRH